MPDQVQLRGGTAADNDAFTGVNREVTVDTTNKTLRVHDGVISGGSKLAAYDAWGRLQVADPVDAADVVNKGFMDTAIADSVTRVPLLEATAADSASLEFTTLIDATYDVYEFEIIDLVSAADGDTLRYRTSSDGGSTWDAGASDYARAINYYKTTAIAASQVSNGTNELTTEAAGAKHRSGTLYLYNPANASLRTVFKSSMVGYRVDLDEGTRNDGVGLRRAAAIVDAVRFFCPGGNITSGTIRMYGRKF